MASVAHNKEPVWYNPRGTTDDRVCYYLRHARDARHYSIEPLAPHPDAHRKPEFEDMVFLHREPLKDDPTMVRDWYGPLSLVDDLLAVNTAGSSWTSSLLYAKASSPPTEDTRVTILGDKVADRPAMVPAWSAAPKSVIELAGGAALRGTEVYVVIPDGADPTEIPVGGTYKIIRHTSANQFEIEYDYDATAVLRSSIDVEVYEACYILDGYADSESAPGVLNELFHTRQFTYALAESSVSASWDDDLGLEILTTTRVVPRLWAFDIDGLPVASSTESRRESFQVISKELARQTIVEPNGTPTQDDIEFNGETKIQIPPIMHELKIPYIWARANKGSVVMYDEDYQISPATLGPFQFGVPTATRRRVVLEANVDATIAAELASAPPNGTSPPPGGIFTFMPESYTIRMGSYHAYAATDGNAWARSQLRIFNIGPFLIDGTNDETGIGGPGNYRVTPSTPAYYGPGTVTTASTEGDGVDIHSSSNPVILSGQVVPWGEQVLWDVRTQRARWGYWIIDFVFVELPASPVT